MSGSGWYPQNDGRERFWNGERWTEQWRQAAQLSAPAPGWYPNPEPGGQGMRYWDGRSWTAPPSAPSAAPRDGNAWPVLAWFGPHWIVTLVLVILIVGGIGSLFGGEEDPAHDSAKATPRSGTSSSPTATSSPTEAPVDPRSDCPRFPKARLDGLAEGAKRGVTVIPPAVAVPIPEDVTNDGSGIGYTKVPYLAVAVHVKKGADDQVVVIATGVKVGDGLTIDTEPAVTFFTWGVAATQGSPIDEFRDAVLASDASTQALLCLR